MPQRSQALPLTAASRAQPVPRVDEASSRGLRSAFEAHYASIWRLLRRLGVREAQLDDCAQEVFWVAARRFAEIEPGREHPFLYGVALRVAAQEVRRQRAQQAGVALDAAPPLVAADPSPEQALAAREERALLDRVLDAMGHELREVLVLFELEGLSVQAIAALYGIPLGTASSRLRRAREEFSAIAKRVRAKLATQPGDGP